MFNTLTGLINSFIEFASHVLEPSASTVRDSPINAPNNITQRPIRAPAIFVPFPYRSGFHAHVQYSSSVETLPPYAAAESIVYPPGYRDLEGGLQAPPPVASPGFYLERIGQIAYPLVGRIYAERNRFSARETEQPEHNSSIILGILFSAIIIVAMILVFVVIPRMPEK